jgi:hypothetical protein
MQAELQINRVEDAMEWLETAADGYTATQSISWLIDQVGMLCKSLAFVNNQMAVAKKIMNRKKTQVYNNLLCSSIANNEFFSPSIIKDYVSARIEQEQYDYDICERCSRTILHTIEALRTCVSALKEEAKTMNYQ